MMPDQLAQWVQGVFPEGNLGWLEISVYGTDCELHKYWIKYIGNSTPLFLDTKNAHGYSHATWWYWKCGRKNSGDCEKHKQHVRQTSH